MKRWLRRISLGVGTLLVLWCGAGLVLTLAPTEGFEARVPADAQLVTVPGQATTAAAPPATPAPSIRTFQAPDGARLVARHVKGRRDSDLTVVLLHGVLSTAAEYDILATRLNDASGAEILTLDLRGHGASDGTPGDVAYIGQYGEDVGGVLAELRRNRPRGRIVLAGYSMGGGIVLRYAEQATRPAPDAYLLFAPLMGPDSPTARSEPPVRDGDDAGVAGARNGSRNATSGMKLHVRRLIGLAMLNAVGVRALNDLETLVFDVPADHPIRGYTYRALVGMTPARHVAALEADALPLLTIVGAEDQAFHVDAFPDVIGRHANGTTRILESVDHDGLIYSAEAAEIAGAWLEDLSR